VTTHANVACARCGAALAPDARFCGGCGNAVAPTHAATSASAPSTGTSPDLSGRVIAGRYKILSRLGEGGMGAVYRAEQLSLKRTVALKLLKQELSAEPGLVRRFNAEAELAAKLTHPNTVTLFDFGQDDDGTLFITMELLAGKSLREVITFGPLPLPRALAICEQITASLADAHGHGIVHRDLKPDNVMLCEQGKRTDVVKVLDFGIAKLRDERTEGVPAAVTRAGDLLGTPQYMAPEQIRGDAVDARTDVYALGAVVYEMLTGRLPFEAPTVMAILSKHLTEMPPPPSQRRPDLGIPPQVDQLVMDSLQKDAARRPQSMDAFAERLAAIRHGTTAAGVAFAPTAPRVITRPPGVPMSVPVHNPVFSPPPVQTVHPQGVGMGMPMAAPPAPAWTPAAPPDARPAGSSKKPLIAALIALLLIGGIVTVAVIVSGGGGDKKQADTTDTTEQPPPEAALPGVKWNHPNFGFTVNLPPGFVEGAPLGPQIVQFNRNKDGVAESLFVSAEQLPTANVTEEQLQAALNQTMAAIGGTLVDARFRTIQGQRRLSAIYDFTAGLRVQMVVYLRGTLGVTIGYAAPTASFPGTADLRTELFERRVDVR
jgi:serine/threonine-protein kinase